MFHSKSLVHSLLRTCLPLLSLSLLLSACASAGSVPETPSGAAAAGESAGPPSSAEPVKLLFYVNGPTLTNTEFRTLIAEPVKKRYPHITLERIEPPSGVTIEEVFTSGPIPDLSLIINPHPLLRLKAVEDLRPWIQKHQFDESRLKPVLYDHIKEFGKNGEIVAIPFNANQAILYYNKDIFDKFGVEYPPADKQLSLEELLELGKQLTRSDNGMDYIGYDPGGPLDLSRNVALPVIDSDSGAPLLSRNPEWTRLFQFAKTAYEVPGYIGPNNQYVYGRDAFMKDRKVALRVANLANMVGPLEELRQQGTEFNWDLAPIPNFSNKLGKAREAQVHSFVISNKSEHKEEAFLAVKEILTDEVQGLLSRNARVPAVINPELEEEFGRDIPVLKDKNVRSVFIGEQQKTHRIHEYEDQVSKWVTEATKDVAVGGIDINTALRKADENIARDVERLKKNE
ncbi:ABC transporter substrate-binding protein [Paenibacillus mucilaginosus]|uniref:Family 1 extracellular solute-binding protein n=2 Tax=Paenibacillus mucilaginosus TaxID=61624 RepID=V9IRX3_9BACL|nr:ABC transporter substrate-binding protein [Paenibacillus mucilaginosus]AEI43042.1 extracellular solute-binding protein family 1 [Paenibacillus mucilaginosus KNP414]AFK65434.1 family 1 extracellular solute-binding protein [Paenibacillus mucilaginosus K02]MCG7215981.1 ABC transporter substrate-binding protein [Paenibacillus mucilaginosus]WDM24666.1 carbohydrate ABC transporter substrate-binding protein [Paenibacillus mucilaginosus]